MATYPIKVLKDETGVPFVPLVSSTGITSPDGTSLEDSLNSKLEKGNIIAGDNIILTKDGNNITITGTASGAANKVIDNLTTETANVGVLDAHQGYVLNNKIVEMAETLEGGIPKVINNLTTVDTINALSAYQGYLLNNKFNDYLALAGGTLTGTLNIGQSDDACLQLGTDGRINANNTNHTILGFIGSEVWLGHSNYNLIIRSASAQIPTLNITHDGAYSSSGNDYTLRLSTTKGVHLDLGYDGLQCKKADNTPNKMYLQYTGGGVQFGRTENACNLDLYGAVNFKNSGTIVNYNDTTGSTLMKIGSNNKRTNIIRVYSSDQTYAETACYGFTMAYSGDGSGTGNKLIFFADNQNSSTQVEAIAIANDGVVNFGKTVTKQGANVPAVFIQSSQPTAKQTGDIWIQ